METTPKPLMDFYEQVRVEADRRASAQLAQIVLLVTEQEVKKTSREANLPSASITNPHAAIIKRYRVAERQYNKWKHALPVADKERYKDALHKLRREMIDSQWGVFIDG